MILQSLDKLEPDECVAVVESFDAEKGYGVVTLLQKRQNRENQHDAAIALLHMSTLRQVGLTHVTVGASLHVRIAQTAGGRIVSEILSWSQEGWGEDTGIAV